MTDESSGEHVLYIRAGIIYATPEAASLPGGKYD